MAPDGRFIHWRPPAGAISIAPDGAIATRPPLWHKTRLQCVVRTDTRTSRGGLMRGRGHSSHFITLYGQFSL
eukprot:871983-Prymnesium_polylepis.1